MLRKARRRAEMYMDGCVSTYESVRCSTTSYNKFSVSTQSGTQQLGVVTHQGRADSVPELLKTEEDISERAMMREKLDLAWAVEDNIIIYKAISASA
jgi:hypothetical protein